MACKSKKKSIYEDGGTINPGLYQLGQVGGNFIQQQGLQQNDAMATIGGGALKGAATGAAFGPWGAAIGGVVGGIGGAIKNKQNKEAMEAQNRAINQANIQQSVANFQRANSIYEDGGMLTNDSNITQYNGYPHEMGGLSLNDNAEVETGETRGIGNTKDYIFSDNLEVTKDKTFADASKEIEKKYKGYENDRFANANKDKELSELMFEQEAKRKEGFQNDLTDLQLKYPSEFGSHTMPDGTVMQGASHEQAQELGLAEGVYRDGGKIKIKPSHRGLFTKQAKAAGMGVQAFANKVLANKENYSPTTVKRANFANVFGGRNYENGGMLDYQTGGLLAMNPPIDPPTGGETEETTTTTSTTTPTTPIETPTPATSDEWVPGEEDFTRVLGAPAYTTDEELIAWNDMMERKFPGQHTRRRDFTDLKPAMNKYAEKWNIGAQDMMAKVAAANPGVDYMSDLQAKKKEMLDSGMSYNEMTQALADYAISTYGDIYSKKSDVYGGLRARDRAYYDRAEQMLRQRGALQYTPGVAARNTARATGAGTQDVDDSDFGWRNLISPQFIQPTEQFKSIWNPGETISEGAYVETRRNGGHIYANGGPLQQSARNVFGDYSDFEGGYGIPQLNMNSAIQNISETTKQASGDTPQYTTNPNQYAFEYNPNANISESMKYGDYTGRNKHWTNDASFLYTKPNIEKELLSKGFNQAQINKFFNTPGYAEQFYDALAKNPQSEFSRSQFKNDRRFGPEHMMALIQNQSRIPGGDDTPYLKGKGFELPTNQPQIDMDAFRQQSGGVGGGGAGLDGGVEGQGGLRGFRPDWLAAGVSTLPNLGMGMANMYLANNLDLQGTNAEIYQPDYVDPTRAIQEMRDQYAGVKDVARQVSGGTGNLMSNLIGATASQSKGIAGVSSQYDNINAGIANQAGQFSAQQRQRANDINAQIANQEEIMRTQLKQQGFENLAKGLTAGIGTYYDSKKYADMMNVAGGENFSYKTVGPSWNPQAVKVFKGNGFHYYEDPETGAIKYLDPKTGKNISEKKAKSNLSKSK